MTSCNFLMNHASQLLAFFRFSAVPEGGAAAMPQDLKSLIGTPLPVRGAVENSNVLALNKEMFDLYDGSALIFRKNILDNHPVILALFSGAGGEFTLYRPGQPPLQAPGVPLVYQLLKSIGHSSMAVAQIVEPYLNDAGNTSWVAPMQAFRSRMQSALDGLGATDMPDEWRANNVAILTQNIEYMDSCLKKGVVTYDDLKAYSVKIGPFLAQDVAWAAQTQVKHWMDVMTEWKALLGDELSRTYAASNTIYVARQNNVIFSVLAQFFGPEAINDRLMLIETINFTTTQDEMLGSMTRIIADRSVGQLFFGNYRLMDYELMGGDGRDAIIAETSKRGIKTFLPPAVPFGSRQWPTLVSGDPGPSSIKDLLKQA